MLKTSLLDQSMFSDKNKKKAYMLPVDCWGGGIRQVYYRSIKSNKRRREFLVQVIEIVICIRKITP